jgi:hypothetical protein
MSRELSRGTYPISGKRMDFFLPVPNIKIMCVKVFCVGKAVREGQSGEGI